MVGWAALWVPGTTRRNNSPYNEAGWGGGGGGWGWGVGGVGGVGRVGRVGGLGGRGRRSSLLKTQEDTNAENA